MTKMVLTTEEVLHGYWGSRRLAGVFPATPIVSPDQLSDTDTLVLACTQTRLPASDQRKLVKAWCALLPQLRLKTLMFTSKVSQDLFEAATRVAGLEALSIKWSAITSIAAISDCRSLTALDIGSSPSLTGLAALADLQGLRSLRLENVKEARELGFAGRLGNLVEFGCSGSMWTEQKIANLWPLQDMQDLELLWLVGARVLQDGLVPLHGLTRLRTLHCALNFRASEFSALREAVPSLRHGSPFEHERIAQFCKR